MSAGPQQPVVDAQPVPSVGAPGLRRPGEAQPLCPPFRPAALRWQVTRDLAARAAVVVVMVLLALFGAALDQHTKGPWSMGAMCALVFLWLWINRISIGAAQQLAQVTSVMDKDPAAAEAGIALALRRWPLQRALRLMLYHRLAALRHRQNRWAEAAAICRSVLQYPLGQAAPVRTHLLFLLAEADLNGGDLAGAHAALLELHRVPLSLMEVMQRAGLQVRYEVMSGQDAQALSNLEQKVQAAELMPVVQCGGLHYMLAAAAQRRGEKELAAWLRRRAELFCTPEELALAARLVRI
jgi:hypothetical protein